MSLSETERKKRLEEIAAFKRSNEQEDSPLRLDDLFKPERTRILYSFGGYGDGAPIDSINIKNSPHSRHLAKELRGVQFEIEEFGQLYPGIDSVLSLVNETFLQLEEPGQYKDSIQLPISPSLHDLYIDDVERLGASKHE